MLYASVLTRLNGLFMLMQYSSLFSFMVGSEKIIFRLLYFGFYGQDVQMIYEQVHMLKIYNTVNYWH